MPKDLGYIRTSDARFAIISIQKSLTKKKATVVTFFMGGRPLLYVVHYSSAREGMQEIRAI